MSGSCSNLVPFCAINCVESAKIRIVLKNFFIMDAVFIRNKY